MSELSRIEANMECQFGEILKLSRAGHGDAATDREIAHR